MGSQAAKDPSDELAWQSHVITSVRPALSGDVIRRPFATPKGFAVMWGRTPGHAAAALLTCLRECRNRVTLLGHIASYTPRVSDGVLVQAVQRCRTKPLIHDMVDGAAFWVLPHSAISLRDREQARAQLRQLWAADEALALAFERQHGYPLAASAYNGQAAPWHPGGSSASTPDPFDARPSGPWASKVEGGGGAAGTASPEGCHVQAASSRLLPPQTGAESQ